MSKFAEILGEFAATERRELEVDTSRDISLEIFCGDQGRARSETNRIKSGCIRQIGASNKVSNRAGVGRACRRSRSKEQINYARINPSP